MTPDLPAITGVNLIKLFKKDGWKEVRKANHGIALTKKVGDRYRVVIIPTKTDSLPRGTLMAILNMKQSGYGRNGFLEIFEKYS